GGELPCLASADLDAVEALEQTSRAAVQRTVGLHHQEQPRPRPVPASPSFAGNRERTARRAHAFDTSPDRRGEPSAGFVGASGNGQTDLPGFARSTTPARTRSPAVSTRRQRGA